MEKSLEKKIAELSKRFEDRCAELDKQMAAIDHRKYMREMEAELKVLKESISKPEFEVGKWYRTIGGSLFNFQRHGKHGYEGYGFNSSGRWDGFDPKLNAHYGNPELIPATEEEIESALIAEAEKRGFKKGAKFIPLDEINRVCTLKALDYYTNHDSLNASINGNEWKDKNGKYVSSNPPIYRQGKWAEIIKDEVITICGKEVEFAEHGVNINGSFYPKGLLNQMVSVLKTPGVHSLNVGCSGQEKVTLETINKILDRLK